MNACLVTYNTNGIGREVDVSDDTTLSVKSVHYSSDKGVMPTVITSLFDERKRCQTLMKTYEKTSDEYNRLNSL